MQKHYLVFGAAGSIGGEIVRQLRNRGYYVTAAIRSHHQEAVGPKLAQLGVQCVLVDDVSDRTCFLAYFRQFPDARLDGVAYSVGHCPPNGLDDAIRYPLSQLSFDKLTAEIRMHQTGVLNVFQQMLSHVKDGGCFLFISSAITRVSEDQWPPTLHAHYHAGMIAAEDYLIRGMRIDPAVKSRGIKIHRIAPGAVNTSFHHGGPFLASAVSVNTVGEAVVDALESESVVDREILSG